MIEPVTGAAFFAEQARQLYRYLFEANPVPMWIRDEATLDFLAVNAAAVKTYGYSMEEFLRLKGTDLLVPSEVESYLQVACVRDPQQGDTRWWHHRRKDG